MIRDEIVNAVSVERAWRHLEWLCREVPKRLSGGPEEKRAAAYLRDQLSEAGIPTNLHELVGLVSFPEPSRLTVLEPTDIGEPIVGMTFAHSGSTGPEGVEGELVYVGAGGEDDYATTDVRGKIVLASLSYAPPRPEKARLASVHGARALVVINWGPPENPSVPMGTVKAVWGNPTPETLPLLTDLPAVGISRADGERLRQLLARGSVRVRLVAAATREWLPIVEPDGFIEAGGPEKDDFILFGGHFDAWGGGATDNATGNVAVLEVARVLAANRDRLRRSVRIVFWPAHENGIMEGSTWFVDRFWDDLDAHGVLYLNVDSPGMRGTTRWFVWSSPETVAWHQTIEQQVAPGIEAERHPLPKIGDQSFFGVGIPAIFPLNQFDKEQVSAWGGAIFGPWYQSTDDTIDVADPAALGDALRYYAAYMSDICTRPILPFEFVSVADIFVRRFDELIAAGVPSDLGLRELRDRALTLRDRAERVRSLTESVNAALEREDPSGLTDWPEARILNHALKSLSRILTAAHSTVCDRYDQDTYGLSALEQPVPALYDAMQLARLDPTSDEYRLLWSRAIRRRNRVADALSTAIGLIERTLTEVDRK